MRTVTMLLVLATLVVCFGCGGKEPAEPAPEPEAKIEVEPVEPPVEPFVLDERFIAVDGQCFLDPEGRQILFHGMSVISKDPKENYQSWHSAEEFALMRDWGMNCIRLGIIWDGIEPEPGQYDEEYLKKVDQRVAWAKEHGIYVFLDMHQDLYSVLYSDGAPEWATLIDGKEHIHSGGVWSDAYFESPAVQAALDNFWDNTPGPGDVGIQDRFGQMWQHVAKRYADQPHVLGYDLFNEPNAGSLNPSAQLLMILKFAEVVKELDGDSAPTPEQLLEQWLIPEERAKHMKRLGDMRIYKPVLGAPEAEFQKFEREKVVPMFQRVTDAIREVDPNHVILLETSMSANMGVYTGIEPINGPDGKRDPQQAYAPHGYDIVVDTPDLAAGSSERVELIFARHAESAERLNMPTIIGEWGAFGGSGEGIIPSARFVVEQFEKHLFGDTYWEFGKYVLDASYLHVLNRGVPQRVAGTLVAYQNDFETNAFTCTWKEDPAVTAPTRIYLPERCFPGKDAVKLEPAGNGFEVEPAAEGSKNVVLVIAPTGEEVERTVSVAPAS